MGRGWEGSVSGWEPTGVEIDLVARGGETQRNPLLRHPHVVRLEARDAPVGGPGGWVPLPPPFEGLIADEGAVPFLYPIASEDAAAVVRAAALAAGLSVLLHVRQIEKSLRAHAHTVSCAILVS